MRSRRAAFRKDAASEKGKDKMEPEEVSGYLFYSETLSDLVEVVAARQYRRAEIELNGPISGGTEWWTYLGRPQQQKTFCTE